MSPYANQGCAGDYLSLDRLERQDENDSKFTIRDLRFEIRDSKFEIYWQLAIRSSLLASRQTTLHYP
jgi:hypothetical protein